MANSNTSFQTANYDVYDYLFPFEEAYHHDKVHRYFRNLPISLPFVIVAVYITLVFLGQNRMKHKAPFHLRGVLFAWNSSLAIITIGGVYRTIPQIIYTVRHFGWHHSVCGSVQIDGTHAASVYTFVFLLLKVVELADTAFVVLRKQPLYFLHWYHHSTVLLYCWYSYFEEAPSGRWFAFNNGCIHAVMYSYYALKSLSVRIPRSVAMTITVVQLSQMVVGCFVNYYAYRVKQLDISCGITTENIRLSALMYASYFMLFLWYFYKAYIQPNQVKMAKTKQN